MAKSKKRTKAQNGKTEPIYRKDKNCFELRFTYIDIDGSKKRKSFTADSAPACEQKRDQFFKNLELRKNGVVIDSTIPEILRVKNERRKAKNKCKEQGYGRNEDTIKFIEKSSIGKIPIKDITVQQLDHFLVFELPRYANDTIEKIYRMLKSAFVIAFNKEIISMNPFEEYKDDLSRPESCKETKKIEAFSVEEQQAFVKAVSLYSNEKTACNKYHHQLLIELFSGLRMGEINALTTDDIDFNKKEIDVNKTISRDRNKKPFISKRTKTDQGIRQVPMIPIVEDELRKAINEMIPNPNNLIFCNKKTKGLITTQQVNSAYKRICKRAGIKESGQHQLRHTFGTRCVEAGVDYKALSDIMGHKDIHVTIDTYISTLDTHKSNNMKKVADYLEHL